MKITIDTTGKTISIDDSVNIENLMDTIKKLLPKGEWKEYSIIPVQYNYPISLPYVIPNPFQPFAPYEPGQPYYTTTTPWCVGDDIGAMPTNIPGVFVSIID